MRKHTYELNLLSSYLFSKDIEASNPSSQNHFFVPPNHLLWHMTVEPNPT